MSTATNPTPTVVPEAVLWAVTTLDPSALADLTLAEAISGIWDGWTLVLADHTTPTPGGFVAVLCKDTADPDTGERAWVAIKFDDSDRIWQRRALRYRWAVLDHTHHLASTGIAAPTLVDLLSQFPARVNRIDSPWVAAAAHLLGVRADDLLAPAHSDFTGVEAEREAARLFLALGVSATLWAQVHMYPTQRGMACPSTSPVESPHR